MFIYDNIKTHILCLINILRKSCRLWDNVEKYGRAGQATDDNIIRRMRIVCWITKTTNTHSKYVIRIAFPWQQWLGECTSVLRHAYTACLLLTRNVIMLYCDRLKHVGGQCMHDASMEVYKATGTVHRILHFVFYGNESWSLTSRKEQKLRVFKKRALRIRGVKMEDVTGGRKKYVRRTFIICTPSRSITRRANERGWYEPVM